MKKVLILLGLTTLVSSCANVSIRNYRPLELKANERTIVGSFDVFNSSSNQLMQECKLSILLPDGKTVRRYFSQNEDKGLVVTSSEVGNIKLHSVDCGDGSFSLALGDQNYVSVVGADTPVTYFGHVLIVGSLTGMSDTTGAVMLGSVGLILAGATRTNNLNTIKIEDRWAESEKVFKVLVPSHADSKVKKSIFKK